MNPPDRSRFHRGSNRQQHVARQTPLTADLADRKTSLTALSECALPSARQAHSAASAWNQLPTHLLFSYHDLSQHLICISALQGTESTSLLNGRGTVHSTEYSVVFSEGNPGAAAHAPVCNRRGPAGSSRVWVRHACMQQDQNDQKMVSTRSLPQQHPSKQQGAEDKKTGGENDVRAATHAWRRIQHERSRLRRDKRETAVYWPKMLRLWPITKSRRLKPGAAGQPPLVLANQTNKGGGCLTFHTLLAFCCSVGWFTAQQERMGV